MIIWFIRCANKDERFKCDLYSAGYFGLFLEGWANPYWAWSMPTLGAAFRALRSPCQVPCS